MAKKSTKKIKTESTELTPKSCCQYCKNHKNNPSFCKINKKYVSRKQEACEKFK